MRSPSIRALVTALTLTLTAGCGGAAIGGKQAEGTEQGPIKLGLTTALSGTYSEFGVPMKNGIELAIKEYNDAGGVLGRRIELVSYDDQLVAETAQTNMRRLLDEDRVDFVLAPAGSGPTLAVVPLVQAKQKIMMNTLAQATKVVYPDGPGKPPNPNVFSFALGNDVEAKFLGAYLGSHHSKVALIAESTPYGETGVAEIEKVLVEGGKATLVAKERYDQQATDVTAQMARIKKSGADAIAMIGLGNDTATVRQAMARLGMLDTPFLISYGAASLPYQERAKKLVNGTIMVGYAAFGGREPSSREAKKFAEAYKGAYGNDRYYGTGQWPIPSFGGTPASAYDSVKVLLEAIKRAGSIDQTSVTKVLESGKPFQGARGEYTFSDTEHAAVTTELLSTYAYKATSDTEITFERAPN